MFFSGTKVAVCQSDTLIWHEGIKLKQSDFSKGINYVDIVLHYSYTFEHSAFGKVTPVIIADVIFNRETSSISDSTSNYLKYAQLMFDIEGFGSKLLRYKVLQLGELKGSDQELNKKLDHVLFQTSQETALLKKEMNQDIQSKNVNETYKIWEVKIYDLINKTPNVLLENQLAKWQLGCFIGIANNIFAGKTKNYFKNATGLNYGFEVDVRKSRFAIDLTLALNKSNALLERNGTWQPNTKTSLAAIELTYGIKIPGNKWLTVPYAGLSVNEITPRKADREDKRKLTGYSPAVGIELNRNFRNREKYGEKVTFFYKAKLSVNPSNMISKIGGTQVNFRVAIGFDTSLVKKGSCKRTDLFLSINRKIHHSLKDLI